MDSTETNGRPLASTIQQPEASTQPPTPRRKRQHSSPSSDERVGGTKSTSSRRRSGIKKESLFAGPHTGASRGDSLTMQPSASPTQMSPELSSVSYTRTGRISKAKKGRKVHNCDCGRVSQSSSSRPTHHSCGLFFGQPCTVFVWIVGTDHHSSHTLEQSI